MPSLNDDSIDINDPPGSVNPYNTLGVAKDASGNEVKAAYRKAALKHHPGKKVLPCLC